MVAYDIDESKRDERERERNNDKDRITHERGKLWEIP
jgi:hypothetical protein